MKSIPDIDYSVLQKLGAEPKSKYHNLSMYITERNGGVQPNEMTLDKKLRTFFEDMISEILKSPEAWDRTRNINFMELFNYLEKEEPDRAIAELKIAVKLDPIIPEAHFFLGRAYLSKREPDQAISECQIAAKTVPDIDDSYVCLVKAFVMKGDKLTKAGKTPEASEAYRRAREELQIVDGLRQKH